MRYKILLYKNVPIKVYENGQIFNCKSGKEYQIHDSNNGPVVYINNKVSVGRILAEAFVPRKTAKHNYLIYLDGNKSNYSLQNLRWLNTPTEKGFMRKEK